MHVASYIFCLPKLTVSFFVISGTVCYYSHSILKGWELMKITVPGVVSACPHAVFQQHRMYILATDLTRDTYAD